MSVSGIESFYPDQIIANNPDNIVKANAFDVRHHINAVRNAQITPDGIRMDLESMLGEISGVYNMFQLVQGKDGLLYSPEFKQPLVEMYARPTGCEIFDQRAEADVMAINQYQEWARAGPFNAILVSPSTEGMSDIAMFEHVNFENGIMTGRRFSVPHLKKSHGEMLIELTKFALQFAPESETLSDILGTLNGIKEVGQLNNYAKYQPYLEKQLLALPIQVNFSKGEFQQMIERTFKMGDQSGTQTQFQRAIELLKFSGFIDLYTAGCFSQLSEQILQERFNNIVNNFLLIMGRDSSSIDYDGRITLEWNPSDFGNIAGACGSINGKGNNSIFGNDSRLKLDTSRYHLDPEKFYVCDSCGAIHSIDVKRGHFVKVCPCCGYHVPRCDGSNLLSMPMAPLAQAA